MVKSVDERIRRSRILLGNPYAYLDGDGYYEAEFPEDRDIHADRLRLLNQYAHLDELEGVGEGHREDAQPTPKSLIDPSRLFPRRLRQQRLSRREIEERARRLQRELWVNRAKLFPDGEPTPLQVVDPEIGLRALGFSIDASEPLQQYVEDVDVFRVAGVLDRANGRVQISAQLDGIKQRFTMAHELGHAVLHPEMTGLHRDRALDGSAPQPNPIETEANRFAAAFLMPEKLVRQAFQDAFDTDRFVLDEASAFGLAGKGLSCMKGKSRRELARELARSCPGMGLFE